MHQCIQEAIDICVDMTLLWLVPNNLRSTLCSSYSGLIWPAVWRSVVEPLLFYHDRINEDSADNAKLTTPIWWVTLSLKEFVNHFLIIVSSC